MGIGRATFLFFISLGNAAPERAAVTRAEVELGDQYRLVQRPQGGEVVAVLRLAHIEVEAEHVAMAGAGLDGLRRGNGEAAAEQHMVGRMPFQRIGDGFEVGLGEQLLEALQVLLDLRKLGARQRRLEARVLHQLPGLELDAPGLGQAVLVAVLVAQLLEEDLPAGKQLNSVLLIKGAGQHLLKLINEVLEIARIDSGEASLELAPTMINDLLEEATHYIAPMGKIRDIEIQSEVAPGLWATANRQKLLQVVLNLLSNALKYGPVSSVVRLKAYRRDDRIIIEVQDAGPGIPRALRERVFTPFDRLGAENTKVEGTGLGLALSKQIMLAMQGSIHLAEDSSLFWLEMAACAPDIPAPSVNPGAGRTRPLQLSDKHSILYVEDNMSNRALVEAIILRQPDLRIHCVSTIKQATEYLAEVTPSLILIDLNLPDGSGERLVEHVHAAPRLRQIPMMILSADALPESINRLKAAGVAHYMTKPLDVAMFNKQVRELIQAQEAS